MRTFKRTAVIVTSLAAALVATPAVAENRTIMVPDDFVAVWSDTRETGHYEVVETGLRVWTEGTASTDKVAEYVATNTPLANVGAASLDYTTTTGATPPGFQLVTDFDGDGTPDGILVGEPSSYGSDWWLNNAAAQSVKDNAPNTGGGFGSDWYGTLDEWSSAFPDADVLGFGFSLGSGVLGDGIITAINFGGDAYTFAEPVEFASKEECKNGGWASSTSPEFRNQGACVSHFAAQK